MTIIMILCMFCLPAFIIWLTKRSRILNTVGGIGLCYITGLVLAFLPLPYDKNLTQTVASVIVTIAIPMVLFTVDLTGIRYLTRKTIIAFSLMIASVTTVSALSFVIARTAQMENANVLAGMAAALYIGGTPNLVFVGEAIGNSELTAAANVSDVFVGGIYFLLLLTAIPKLYSKLLDKPGKNEIQENLAENGLPDEKSEAQEYNFRVIPRDKKSVLRLLGVIGLALVCFGIGAALELLITGGIDDSLYLLIAVSVLGVAISFIKPVRDTKGTYQIAQYFLLIFSIGLSMSLDLSVLAAKILPTLIYFGSVQIACILLHLCLCKFFGIDSGTVIITSTAGIYGPPFIAPAANAAGRKDLIAPGVICGAVGLALGNFIGLGLGMLLGLF